MPRERWARIQSRIIHLLDPEATPLDRSSYQLENGGVVVFRNSKAYGARDMPRYWFGLPRAKFESHPSAQFFLLLVCGSPDQVLVLDGAFVSDLVEGVETASDKNWKIHVFKSADGYEVSVAGKPRRDASEHLNRYDLVVPRADRVGAAMVDRVEPLDGERPEPISIEEEIMTLDNVAGATLHDRLVDMIRQVGLWMRYESVPSYRVRPDAPYQLDVAWLSDGAVHIAVEVQIGGNVTEAKDRLIFAKRFGARKCVVVSNPESVDRIRSVFRYESDIKHWVEIWGLERIHNMFVDGRSFFDNFNEFNRHQYRDEVVDIV